MQKKTKRWIGVLALAFGAFGVTGVMLKRKKRNALQESPLEENTNVWARPGMPVVFRAELMPGLDRTKRTFYVDELLPSGRVLLRGIAGEHAEGEFEPLRRQ